jgi:hypothetical protein
MARGTRFPACAGAAFFALLEGRSTKEIGVFDLGVADGGASVGIVRL